MSLAARVLLPIRLPDCITKVALFWPKSGIGIYLADTRLWDQLNRSLTAAAWPDFEKEFAFHDQDRPIF